MKEHVKSCEFAKLTGETYQELQGLTITPAYDLNNPKPTGAMITEFQDLKGGGTTISIPIFIQNSVVPKIGDADLTNEGVTDDFVWIRAQINKIGFAHELVKGLQAQELMTNGLSQRLNDSKPSLGDRLTKWIDKDLYHTVFNGVSISLCTMSGQPGCRSSLTPHSHANFYVGGDLKGLVGGNDTQGGYANRAGTEAYETDLAAALNSLTTDDVFNAALITKLEYQAKRLGIPRFLTSTGEKYIMIVHPAMIQQLNEDPAYLNAKLYGGMGQGWDGSLYNNYRTQWSQTLIFEGSRIPGVQGELQNITTYGTGVYNNMPKYGNTDFYTNLKSEHPSFIKLGILCGPDMLIKAYGADAIRISGEIHEGAEREQVYLRAVMAYVLADYFDKDSHMGVGSTTSVWKNQSSMVFATVSPDA
jgi:N4-gp56 family major capsid protein